MNAKELRELSRGELREKEEKLRRDLFDLRFKHGTRQLEDTSSIKRARKDLARLLTVASQKELAERVKS
ncbi:MAG: 50S ribosomal protein L29 [Deltaproteobacteria bacterium]|nr:50S ribosomal protein L29 [Deltaproteobacteria bacterium]